MGYSLAGVHYFQFNSLRNQAERHAQADDGVDGEIAGLFPIKNTVQILAGLAPFDSQLIFIDALSLHRGQNVVHKVSLDAIRDEVRVLSQGPVGFGQFVNVTFGQNRGAVQ